MIDGLPISKRAWAKAFYEKDIIQTSKVLFEALFSEQEMQQCTLNGKKGTPELSAVKMLAVLSMLINFTWREAHIALPLSTLNISIVIILLVLRH